MPVGTTVAIVSVSAVLLAGGGFLAGRATAPDGGAEALAAQAQTLDTILDGQTEILTAAARPVVIDAEIRDKLAEVPPQCRGEQDAGGLACAWATCLQYGQSSAQRPECRAIEAAYLKSVESCAEPAP